MGMVRLLRILAVLIWSGIAQAGTPPSSGTPGTTANSATNVLHPTLTVSHAGSQALVLVIAAISTTNTSSVPLITSVVGASGGDGLSFTKRTQQQKLNLTGGCLFFGACSISVEVWWSPANSNFTGHNVDITWGSNFNGGIASAVEVWNVNSNTSPWDTNAVLPIVNSSLTGTVPSFSGLSTTQTDDLMLSVLAAGQGGGGYAGRKACFLTFASWTNAGNVLGAFSSISQTAYTQSVAAPQSSIGVNMTDGTTDGCPTGTTMSNGWVLIMDALTGNPPTAPHGSGWMMMK